MFLSCGLVSKNHMLLNLPGILIPQNANHLLPGLSLCQLESLSQDSKMRGLFGLRTITHPSCLWPITPYVPISPLPKKSLSWINIAIPYQREGHCRRSWRNHLCSQLTLPIFYVTGNCLFLVPFIQMDLFWGELLYSKFLALRLLRQIHIYIYISNLYYFIYLSG